MTLKLPFLFFFKIVYKPDEESEKERESDELKWGVRNITEIPKNDQIMYRLTRTIYRRSKNSKILVKN